MTTSLATLIARARQGDAQAIAQLITRSLTAEGIVAQGHWQSTDLYVDLESDSAISQSQVVPHIRRGLLRLGLTCPIETVWVRARRVGLASADWRESFGLEKSLFTPSDRGPGELGTATSPQSPTTSAPEAEPDPPRWAEPSPEASFTSEAQIDSRGLAPENDQFPQQTALSDTTLIALAHLAPVVSYLVLGSQWLGGWPLFWGGSFLLPWRVVAPLTLLLVKGAGASAASDTAYGQRQAKAALNFQLTMFISWVVTMALMVVLVGFLLVVPLALFEIVSCIVATVRASEGKPVRYWAIRFVR